ncbi:hypothetical protein PR202_gb20671 [Eleusine coracana subsp. coracana]|uniref:Uncharacterized protein n=1 Tax=Eleusine coracana subsp. coracana TaxID=191504 RepID=A0AAV5FBB4_ELECO|nr:hypothetical protein PR202_gb20671 [Eleusine coracana subsp. coracana]
MIRHALGIIPSVASTAKNGFDRVVSLTGSFNDRTSLLLAAASEPVPEQSHQPQQEPAPVTIGVAFDIEAAAPPETVAGGDEQGQETTSGEDVDVEAKRVAKSVHTVCLFAASASIVLFVNLPTTSKPAGAGVSVLYSVDMAFICLGLFTSLGLSMFSIVAKSGTNPAAVARVQKQAMVMAVAFVLVSFTLRVGMMLPPRSFEPAWLVFVLLAGAVAVYLALAWKLGGGPRGADAASGPAVAGTADDRV